MKKKLLITLGCSWTEGLGIYSQEDEKYFKTIDKSSSEEFRCSEEFWYIQLKNENRFHEFGWPNQLGKKLGYDEVWNLGKGGSSTSGQLKLFIEHFNKITLEDYNVFIIWLLTEPSRFSFYLHGQIRNYMPVDEGGIESAMIQEIDDQRDYYLEQKFYLQILQNLASARGWEFLWYSYQHDNNKILLDLINDKDDTHISLKEELSLFNDKDKYLSICHHPNQMGYESITNDFYQWIEENKPYLINNSKPQEFKWKWLGNPKKYY
jgi:hypothetical protein